MKIWPKIYNKWYPGSLGSILPLLQLKKPICNFTVSAQKHFNKCLFSLNPLCNFVHSHIRAWHYLQKSKTIHLAFQGCWVEFEVCVRMCCEGSDAANRRDYHSNAEQVEALHVQNKTSLTAITRWLPLLMSTAGMYHAAVHVNIPPLGWIRLWILGKLHYS